MAEGVGKSFRRNFRQKLADILEDAADSQVEYVSREDIETLVDEAVKKASAITSEELNMDASSDYAAEVAEVIENGMARYGVSIDGRFITIKAGMRADKATERETYQAMESLVHNLNTMHCLPGSEKIWVRYTETGNIELISMQGLYDTFRPGMYEALSINSKTGESEFKPITAVADQGQGRTLVTIRTKSGQRVRVTDNHKVLSVNKASGKIYKDIPKNIESVIIPRKVPALGIRHITVTDYTDKKPRVDTPFRGEVLPLTEDFAYFLGIYMGDGSVVGGSTVSITCCSKLSFQSLSQIADRAFGMHVTYYEHSMSDGISPKAINFNLGTYFCDALKHMCGKNASEKRVPGFILSGSDSVKRAFLNGYNDTDGRHTSKYTEIGSVSFELISGVQYLICSLGELPAIGKSRVKQSGYKTSKPLHSITLGCNASKRIGLTVRGDIAFELPKYDLSFVRSLLVKGKNAIKRRRSNAVRLSELETGLMCSENQHLKHLVNVFNVPIVEKSISNSGDEHVFDISVADNENFVTEHMIAVSNSRAGAQTPFASVNLGTDTSPEGRMATRNFLLALGAGLGHGETCIFPISIFKVKEGVNYNPGDPNYDLFQLACKVSAKRLFPNFVFIDAPFNIQYYKPGHPETEVVAMGCRTRVMGNVHDPEREIAYSRGNLSFTSINLPRLAIEAKGDEEKFYEGLRKMLNLVAQQLLDRFKIQAGKKVYNYPFLMGQGVWLDSDKLGSRDSVGEVLKHGTLSIGFIGLAEALTALYGHHHGESAEAQEKGLAIIGRMREFCDWISQEKKMNFSLLATPAEGLSGRFVKMDRERYGSIPGVTDREYYTNSFHVPVWYKLTAFEKIRIEAPYHALCNAGHITYVELDGDTAQNVEAFEQIVRFMHDCGIGYGSINHPVDRDPACGYVGVIGDTCPRCGRHEGEAIPDEVMDKLRKEYPYIKDLYGLR